MKDVFAKMMKLRLLKLYYSDDHDEYKMMLPKDFEFPPSLRYLYWEGLECLPLNFHGENLVAINLKSSNIKKLWKGNECLERLKFIDLSDSQQLTTILKVSSCMPNLERLNLRGCKSFHKFHSFIGVEMKFLRELRLRGTRIKELPSGIRYLESLEILDLSECSKFKKFPNIFANLGHLRELYLYKTGIKELPNSIGYLEFLEILDLASCSNFEKFPEIQGNMKCLKEIYLGDTAIKELPNSIGSLRALELLHLRNTGIKELPNAIRSLEALHTLNVSQCSEIKKIPKLVSSLRFIDARDCQCLESLPNPMHLLWSFLLNCLKSLNQDFRHPRNKVEVFIPRSRGIPEWISHKSMGCEVRIELPKNWYEDNDFLGFALFIHYVLPDNDDNEYDSHQNYYCIHSKLSISPGDQSMWLPLNLLDGTLFCYFREHAPVLWVSYFPQIAISKEARSNRWNIFKAHVSIEVDDPYNCAKKKVFKVKSCGIHPIYDGDHHQQI